MEGVLVQIKNGSCTLTATDFTTWLTTTIPAADGDLAFVFQWPKDVVRASKHFEGEMILETEESGKDHWFRLTMSCGHWAAQIEVFSPEDYPVMPEIKARHTYTVNAARLLERVEHVKYALRKPDGKLEAKFTHIDSLYLEFGSNLLLCKTSFNSQFSNIQWSCLIFCSIPI